MTYEIATFGCCGEEYYIVYLHHKGLRLAQLMTTDINEAERFIAAQHGVERVIESINGIMERG